MQPREIPIAKLELGLSRLCRSAAVSYNSSGRLAATFYRSETGWVSSEIASLQHLNNQISRFQARTRDVTASSEQISEQATLLGEHLEGLEQLRVSQANVEREVQETSLKVKSLEDEVSDIGKNSGIESLDHVESELRRLRRKLLEEEMSRLGAVITRFLALLERGEADHPRETMDVLSRYLEAPLTSLARERDGYPRLRDALGVLLKAVEMKGMGLNEKKSRKVLERGGRIVDGSLLSLQKEARQAFRARAALLRSETLRELRSRRLELRREHAGLLDARRNLESKRARMVEEIASVQGQVVTRLGRIEKLANEWFGSKVPDALRDRVLLASRG